MAVKRRYGQACPVAHALDMVGDRWALLVVRELRLGARRYADLQASLPGLGPSVLSQRLRDLEQAGVLKRRTLPPPVAAQVYELTEWGAELEPVFAALASWGVRSPVVPLEGDLSEDAVMLGLRTFFVPGDADWDATYEVRLERETYTILVAGGGLDELTRGLPTGPVDATVDADRFAMRSLLTRATSLSAAVDSGQVTVTGDIRAAQRLFDSV
jgi:DNA-binding HxlR family transcriptional regulator